MPHQVVKESCQNLVVKSSIILVNSWFTYLILHLFFLNVGGL